MVRSWPVDSYMLLTSHPKNYIKIISGLVRYEKNSSLLNLHELTAKKVIQQIHRQIAACI